jgi:hypothetical protein
VYTITEEYKMWRPHRGVSGDHRVLSCDTVHFYRNLLTFPLFEMFYVEEGESAILQNIRKFLKYYSASVNARRSYFYRVNFEGQGHSIVLLEIYWVFYSTYGGSTLLRNYFKYTYTKPHSALSHKTVFCTKADCWITFSVS